MSTNPSYCIPSTTGECVFGSNCSLRHDIFKCACGLILFSINRQAHSAGKRHRNLFEALHGYPEALSKANRDQIPKQGSSKRINNQSIPVSGVEGVEELVIACEHCRKAVPSSTYDGHVEEHLRRQRLEEGRAALEEAANDKEGVTVSGRAGIDFGIMDAENAIEVTLTITSTRSAVSLQSCKMASSKRGDEHGVRFSARLRGKSRVVKTGMSRVVSVVFHPAYAGRYDDTLELAFFDLEYKRKFVITRSVEARVGSKEDHELLQPKAPYAKRKVTKFQPVGQIIRSLRPPAWSKTVWREFLPPFNPPSGLIEAVYGPNAVQEKVALSNVKRFMPSQFNARTYGKWFQTLLYLEEERIKLDLDTYSLTDVELKPNHPRYNLLVEGLAENRPSVLVGDFILVSHTDVPETLNTRTWFEGRVHQVHQDHVSLRFGDKFSTYKGTKFDVRFVLNRLPFRRMHLTLTTRAIPTRFSFPDDTHIRNSRQVSQAQIDDIRPRYRPLADDEEQRETVAAIVNQVPGSAPFVVFGPPGTGKTVTIVEAMEQLLDRDPDVCILACAPSNSAADTIVQKLIHRGTSNVFRLNSLSRKLPEVPQTVRNFSLINDNQFFAMPTLDMLKKYKVVVSTCLSAGVPASLGLKRGHFTHIFIDEAGQGKEPEVMVPILSIAGDKTNVILAGDNHQLGPVVHSNIARTLGLKTSYLSRIMDRPIYSLETGRGITIVKLVKNFRSHPEILHFSNENFYKSELQPCGNPMIVRSLESYEELPKPRFPLIFHSILGKDEREKSSPSFFNIDEATQVKKYCQSLVDNKKNKIKGEHIGVITPYHAQRCKILDLLRKDFKTRDIKVGSVEEFQGQERRVIIMSTVRSNQEFVMADIRRSLGFVADQKRLNVALTRAQALLIVIGNPIVLSLDPLWRGFLNFVHTRGGWRGKEIDWDPEEPLLSVDDYGQQRRTKAEGDLEETIQRLKALIVQKHGEDGYEVDLEEDEDAGAFERPILREAE